MPVSLLENIRRHSLIGNDWAVLSAEGSQEMLAVMQQANPVYDEALGRHYWLATWLPIAVGSSGDVACLVLEHPLGAPSGPFAVGAVFVYYHDENRIAQVADDFAEWVAEEEA